jgi:hypothetical protein
MTFVAVNPTMPNNAKFDRDPDFARRVLKLESRHLQQLVHRDLYAPQSLADD